MKVAVYVSSTWVLPVEDHQIKVSGIGRTVTAVHTRVGSTFLLSPTIIFRPKVLSKATLLLAINRAILQLRTFKVLPLLLQNQCRSLHLDPGLAFDVGKENSGYIRSVFSIELS